MPLSTVGPIDIALLDEQLNASLQVAAPKLEGYEILSLIGEGTYGSVWKARETATSVIVAIKRFRSQPNAQCCAEVEHLAGLGSARGIVALRKVHLNSEPYCYVMEYMPGGTVSNLLQESRRRSFSESWQLFRRLIDAMCYVHREGIVHGDIKPDNILLDSAGQPRLCDFGQARGRGSNSRMLGTLFYMPPEQARQEGMPDPRWDIYALGAILYELLTGKKPRFDADLWKLLTLPTNSGTETKDRLEQYARHLERHPHVDEHRHVAGVDSETAMMVDRCLALDFDDRLADANAVQQQIDECERARRSRPLVIFGGLAPAILVSLIGLAVLLCGNWILTRFENDWRQQVTSSNRAVATAIGASIADSFRDRMQTIQDAAALAEWPALLRERDQDSITELLKDVYEDHDEEIYRWTVAGDDGMQLANYGRKGEFLKRDNKGRDIELGVDHSNIGKNFSWRAWFNGVEEREKNLVTADKESLTDMRKRKASDTYMTKPFWREGEPGFAVIAISCPIVEKGSTEPVGVLLGSIPYKQLVRWVGEFVESQASEMRNVVVINGQLQEIYHPHLEPLIKRQRTQRDSQESNNSVSDSSNSRDARHEVGPYRQALKGEIIEPYVDPLDPDAKTYLGSTVNMTLGNGQELAVIVQQDEQAAMAPVRTVKRIMHLLGGGLVALGLAFLASNTYALYWYLKQQRKSVAYV